MPQEMMTKHVNNKPEKMMIIMMMRPIHTPPVLSINLIRLNAA